MSSHSRPRSVLVTGANGFIGNAVARAFVRAGWTTFGLLPSKIESIVSVTEDHSDYVRHYSNIIALLRRISASSSASGVKPLVIFTSGCKDYGSSINPPTFAKLRAEYALKIFEHEDAFLSVLVRPTNVHGKSSSYYGIFFEVANKAAEVGKPLVIPSRPDGICHCMHVDDCGDAYVAIASHTQQDLVSGQIFNISARKYETVSQLGDALVSEYGISKGIEFVDPIAFAQNHDWPPMLVDFPQWTDSEKLRRVTGWSDHRPLFTESLHVYRVAFEAAKLGGHNNVQAIQNFLSIVKPSSSSE